MKYKVGDKVRIKSLDWYRKYANKDGIIVCGNYYFTQNMLKYCGKVLMITNVIRDFYVCKDIDYQFSDEMIEGLVEETELDAKAFNDGYEQGYDDGQHDITEWNLPEGFIFKDENGNVINTTKIILEKKKKEYPQTYEECCKVMGVNHTNDLDICEHCDYKTVITYYEDSLLEKIEALYRLIICRDAYWRIAGDEMGLGKPWEPDWEDDTTKYTLVCINNGIEKDWELHINHILAFPTKEMRDAFYEIFKGEIENCKELL